MNHSEFLKQKDKTFFSLVLLAALTLTIGGGYSALAQNQYSDNAAEGRQATNQAASEVMQAVDDATALFDDAAPLPDGNAGPEAGEAATQSVGYVEEYVDDSSEEASGYGSEEEAFLEENTEEAVHPVTLEFKDARLTDILQILGKENNVNFIYDHSAHSAKKVTMTLTNVSWETALKAVLNVHGLDFTKIHGGVVKIEEAQEKVKRQVYAKNQLLLTRLSYMKASEANGVISEFIKTNAGKEGPKTTIQVDERTNTLIVEAPAETLSRVKALIERLDTQTPQVKIDARIVEVQKDNRDSFGIDWDVPFAGSKSTGLELGSLPVNLGANFAVNAPSDGGVGSLAFKLSPLTSVKEIMMQLQWQETHLNTRILQNTSAIVLNNKTASIESGYVDTIELRGTESGDTKEVSYLLKLEVTPQVTSDGSVSMEVSVESDDPVDDAGTNRKATKKVNTHLIRASGETAAIGGIYTTSHSNAHAAMPYLSQIPILGWLFKNASKTLTKREIIILITPTVINLEASRGTAGAVADLSGDANYNSYENSYQANQGYENQAYSNQQDYSNSYSDNYDQNSNQEDQYYGENQQAQASGNNYGNYTSNTSYEQNGGNSYNNYYDDDSYNENNLNYDQNSGDDYAENGNYADDSDNYGDNTSYENNPDYEDNYY